MNPARKPILLSVLLVLASLSNAFGITLSVSFDPTLNGGSDAAYGFLTSTWTFTYEITETVYSDNLGGAAVVSDSASVMITGAGNSDYNGVFPIFESTSSDFLFWPNYSGDAYLSHDPGDGSESSFSIGNSPNTLAVQNLGLFGPSSAAVSIGGPVEAAHFDGLAVSDGGVQVGTTTYAFDNGVITVIPEASSVMLICVGGLLLVLRRRFRNKG